MTDCDKEKIESFAFGIGMAISLAILALMVIFGIYLEKNLKIKFILYSYYFLVTIYSFLGLMALPSIIQSKILKSIKKSNNP